MKRCIIFFGFLFFTAFLDAEFTAGRTAYTKKKTTSLLSSPQRDSATLGSLPWGTGVEIKTVQGLWVQVEDNGKTGWIFSGNLAEDKPPAENKNDFLPTNAGDTTAATAARPLSRAAQNYADRKDYGSAAADIRWLESVADNISSSEVDSFLKANRKGEFAP
jgi:uncharacterized protein YgiM (DUF1202 family)